MFSRKSLNILLSAMMIISLLLSGSFQASAQKAQEPVAAGNSEALAAPIGGSNVPHYFGPWPNWALSPLTSPNATVDIIPVGGGSGATAVVNVDPLTGGIGSIDITAPGSGYKAANVVIGGGDGNATATATVDTTGTVNSVSLSAGGGGYTSPVVSLTSGGAIGGVASVGNYPLVARSYATDSSAAPAVVPASVSQVDTVTYSVQVGSADGGSFTLTVDAATTAAIAWNALAADVQAALEAALGAGAATVTGSGTSADPWVIIFAVAPTTVTIDGAGLTQPAAPLVPVFVVVPAAMPADGLVQEIQYFNQATAGGSPTPSAGNKFHAYVLHPTGVTDEYNVVWDSGEITVPATADPVGVVETVPVPDVAVATGDVIAFYGAGIPVDITAAGADIFSYPAPNAPVQGATITVGSAEFPLYGQARTYSFGAQVFDNGFIQPMVDATATAYGGVDAIFVSDGGFAYTMPTVEFTLPEDPNGVTAQAHVATTLLGDAFDGMDANGTILPDGIIVDEPGSGYSTAPLVTIINGTPDNPLNGETPAVASATLTITSVTLDTFGSGYVSTPTVTFSDATGVGAGAAGTASVKYGTVTGVTVTNPGTGYLSVGMRKFIDGLPGLCVPPACPTSGKYIPVAVPEKKVYNGIEADEYVIGLVQYRTSFSSDLPPTLVRGYVQLETPANAGISQGYQLQNELLNGTFQDTGYFGVTPPQWLGPVITATKNKPVRIVFRNLLPTGSDGDLFMPVDTTFMGSGMGPMDMMDPMNEGTVTDMVRNPMCGDPGKGANPDCFKDNRATLHLHGGITPWISDGTAHQWTTPAGENTPWPQGVSVGNVPDMGAAGCDAADDGCLTFYYTNQQSARLLFYHDHAWGITRMNVYAGEAAGYLITDDTEKTLISTGAIPSAQIPLVIQDRTFVPDAAQLALQDPTWDTARWGSKGSFWYHHVYMPAQNPGDPGGMSAYGRWMYGPWFWPPATGTKYGPIANPYYDPACNIDDPNTWQYDTDPFCEPEQIPGTPNISSGMEQFNDTPIVNGVAYPTITLQPKSYRFRVLNAANDRFFNFQWYVGDSTTASTGLNKAGEVIGATEVALNPAELAAAQLDPVVFPTPDLTKSPAGPDWIQIGTEGGFLPAPVVVDGQQVTTWIEDPTRFDVGNVDQHSLLLAPAERADVIVDFSKFAGKTLILYNDAPAAFPARIPSYDYYTGAPDLSPNGAPGILPGYGPNTRTIMQVKIAGAPAAAFNLTRLTNAFKHNTSGTGVFEKGQHPIIVGQAAYNSAYGTSFAASSDCNTGSALQRCDGLARVDDTTNFGFNTLSAPTVKMTLHVEPKAIHDETNATTFDEFGRMQANLGVEAQPPTPGLQNVTLYPFVNPATEIIDATNLPVVNVTYDANGLPVSDVKITPISNAADGTQIWRVTHNGVDTHPIHFHLYDVQLVNRVTWDNIIIPTDATELGWKDTVRMAPLEDTIVALRPIIPELPWELPNAVRMLNPMMPKDSPAMFHNVDPQGIPTTPILNQLVNFGWEYVYHCHILSHEEMDMMRPVSVALPPIKPDGLAATTGVVGGNLAVSLSWNDNSIAETSYEVERSTDGIAWEVVGISPSPLDQPNTTGARAFDDTTVLPNTAYQYRIVAKNTVGYLDGTDPTIAGFPEMTVKSTSDPLSVDTPALPVPASPSGLVATAISANQVNLTWTDNATDETGFTIQRCTGAGCTNFADIDGVGANITAYTDPSVVGNTSYSYQVIAFNLNGNSQPSNVATVTTPFLGPVAPSNLVATQLNNPLRVRLTWRDNSNNENLFQVWRSINGAAFAQIATVNRTATQRTATGGTVAYTNTGVTAGNTYAYYVIAVNTVPNPDQASVASNTATIILSGPPAAPSGLSAAAFSSTQINLAWTDNATTETGFTIQRATNATFTAGLTTITLNATNQSSYSNTGLTANTLYYYRVRAFNASGNSAWSNTASATTLGVAGTPLAPSGLTLSAVVAGGSDNLTLTWVDNATNETSFTAQCGTNATITTNVTTVNNIAANSTSYTRTGVPRGLLIYCRVRAANAIGVSAWSNIASMTTP